MVSLGACVVVAAAGVGSGVVAASGVGSGVAVVGCGVGVVGSCVVALG